MCVCGGGGYSGLTLNKNWFPSRLLSCGRGSRNWNTDMVTMVTLSGSGGVVVGGVD